MLAMNDQLLSVLLAQMSDAVETVFQATRIESRRIHPDHDLI